MKKSKLILFLVYLAITTACTEKEPVIKDWETYIADHEAWQFNRLDRLKAERGWLNLAGLFWLDEGENTFGSDPSNDIVFPEGFALSGGIIHLMGDYITMITNLEENIVVNGDRMLRAELKHDQQENTTLMEYESFRWFIIKRGEKYGIRLRNLEHPRIAELDHIPAYPFKKDFVVEAEFHPYDSAKTLQVPTVIEDFYEYYEVPGELHFKLDGKKQSLLPFASGKGFFLIIGDATNGLETYGAGRFLYIPEAGEDKVIIDFNRAYNPPCAFSPFATCPLPPMENILDIEIPAGEKGVHLD